MEIYYTLVEDLGWRIWSSGLCWPDAPRTSAEIRAVGFTFGRNAD